MRKIKSGKLSNARGSALTQCLYVSANVKADSHIACRAHAVPCR